MNSLNLQTVTRPVGESLFSLRDVTYNYNDVKALDGVSLNIHPGERIALLGANGSGKSTLLRLLDGLYFADSGSISFCGEEINSSKLASEEFAFPFRRRVALVFQNPDVQLFNPTVFDEVAFGPLQLRWDKETIRRRVGEALEMMEVAHLKDRSPHRLSGGEKKRVSLASVLVLDPDVLLLDEPTASLDPQSQGHLLEFLGKWNPEKTLITSTHDLDTVDVIANRCLILSQGQLAADGTPHELLNDLELLQRTRLIHAHHHTHPTGETHSHPHRHGGHWHEHEAE